MPTLAHAGTGNGPHRFAIPQFNHQRQTGCFQPPPHLMNQQLITRIIPSQVQLAPGAGFARLL